MAIETPVLGFDIGSTSLRLCRVEGADRRPALTLFDTLELEPGVVVNGVIRDADQVVEAIRELVDRNDVAEGSAAVALPTGSSYLRREFLPRKRGRYDLRAAREAIAEELPESWGEVAVSVTPLTELDEQEVIIAAAPQAAVEALVSVFDAAGLPLSCVDAAGCALYNVVEHVDGMESSDVSALVDIGQQETRIFLLDGYAMVGSCRLELGGHELTAQLRRELSLGFLEAESYKIGGADEHADGVVPLEVQEVIERACQSLASQLARGIAGLAQAARVRRLQGISLTGRSAALSTLRSAIAEQSGVQVRGIAPFRAVQVDPDEFSSAFLQSLEPGAALAFGLALRGRET